MAGGKETPRQKMIGMMYLVLTALLALNVSKEIINAFVTLNDNIDQGNVLISKSNEAALGTFDSKIATLNATGGSKKEVERVQEYQSKARNIRLRTQSLSNFYITEAADMISKVEANPEGDWFIESENLAPIGDKTWLELKDLMAINAKDNYDVATHEFVGGDLKSPVARGLALVDSIHAYRDALLSIMGNYKKDEKTTFSFESPGIQPPKPGEYSEVDAALREAFKTVNPEDTADMANVYRILTMPEMVDNHGEEYPWVAGQFDHAPVVAAAAVFTSLRSKLFQAESIALANLVGKVDVQMFDFNKIEPLAFSGSSYVNQGDSVALKVMIAAYDSAAPMKLRYWINDSTRNPEGMQEYVGDAGNPLGLSGDQTGDFTVYGDIEVKIKGNNEWKPWKYTYKVGKPGGAIALPEMATLYKGYPNKVEASASGYPAEAISLTCSGCSLSKTSTGWTATVPTSGKKATMSLSAKNPDGSSVPLAKQEFKVSDFPKPTVFIGGAASGGKISRSQIAKNSTIFLKLEGSPLVASFSVSSFAVIIGSRKIKCNGSKLSGQALNMIGSLQPGSSLSIVDVKYTGTGPMRAVGGGFEIR